MKMAIDCRALRNAPSGIPNFLVASINDFSRYFINWEFFLLSNEEFHPEIAKQIIYRDNIKVIIAPLLLFKNVSFLWLVTKANFIVNKIKPDLYWSPAFLLPPFLSNKIQTLVTVHDVVNKEFKSTMSLIGRIYAHLLQDYSINKADKLWANSYYTTSAIMKYYKTRRSKDIFTGFFINKTLFKPITISDQEKSALLNQYNVNSNFILFVGTLEPRKNLEFLLNLMPSIKHLEVKLLVVGAKGWGKTKISSIVESTNYPSEKVVFSGFVPSEDLIMLYNLASIFISTSLNEGFGMPQLEAMACGCPVIAPHNSAMIEVVEGAGETVRSWEVNDWVNAITKVLINREEYRIKGLERSKQYEAEFVLKQLFSYINNERS
ncbi:glycosyltransferase family 4 protein [Adhaeribacter radiodurans]|uniref:Glycosyltransferase family 4 protein n=1 Tax=Adhaeribacter radiodurans TaxID=2745197 RepID=A0A7L7L828_9BACT|nr:glycosyltransferase family 1 protein [Adhaeribacter radiodurans]QMU28957.1 glycosyltransferase family 4 protein [Adhaeribacter radiodurans]